jgi:DNA polymerase-3 subunit delta'
MNSQHIVGHQEVKDRFARWLRQDRLASSYLLAGPVGVGKRRTALWLAQCLLCEETPRLELSACQDCPACQQVQAQTHPDLLLVEKPADRNFIPVELFIGTREKRMRSGLCHDISLKPFRGGRRIAIIDDADFLNQEGANCLLKTLEEPPAAAVIFLISSSEYRQLPTIRSRCQVVRFQPLEVRQIEQILADRESLPEGVSPQQLARACEGSLHKAMLLSEPEVLEFRRDWLRQLASLDPGAGDFFESLNAFVDAAGKDSAAKRRRLTLVAELAAEFYRHVMLTLCQRPVAADDTMNHCVRQAVDRWPGDADTAADCLDRCAAVLEQVAANANQALVIESLLCDLGRLLRGEMLV